MYARMQGCKYCTTGGCAGLRFCRWPRRGRVDSRLGSTYQILPPGEVEDGCSASTKNIYKVAGSHHCTTFESYSSSPCPPPPLLLLFSSSFPQPTYLPNPRWSARYSPPSSPSLPSWLLPRTRVAPPLSPTEVRTDSLPPSQFRLN